MYRFKKIAVRFIQTYTPDPRALAIMRIGIALIIISDLIIRVSDLKAHYSDAGLWPTELIYNFGWNTGYWSLHAISGKVSWQIVLFCIHFISACGILIGYKTRWSTFLTWLLTVSLHNRNLFILQGGDDLLRLVLFWGLFLPWAKFFSIDARKSSHHYHSVIAGPAYFLLIASVYLFSALLKTSSEWHSEGSAIYYALSLEQLRLPLGDWLYGHENLMKVLTHLVYYLELFIPVLILFPYKTSYTRLLAFCLVILLHLGFGLTLYVGLFYIIGIVSALGLIPGFFFDNLGIKSTIKKKRKTNSLFESSTFVYTGNAFCAIIICICLIVNLSTAGWFPYELRSEVTLVVNTLRLNQYWGMFSPGVLKEDGWFVYHGMDSIGRQWDLRRNEDYVDYKKPVHIVKMYKSDRWRKLAENMQSDNYTFLRPLYCNYILRKWNSEHPEKKIEILNLYYMQKTNLPEYKTTPVEKRLFCVCDEQ